MTAKTQAERELHALLHEAETPDPLDFQGSMGEDPNPGATFTMVSTTGQPPRNTNARVLVDVVALMGLDVALASRDRDLDFDAELSRWDGGQSKVERDWQVGQTRTVLRNFATSVHNRDVRPGVRQ